MWTAARRAVVIDLGLVRHSEAPAVTTAGIAWGTAGFLSPEQAEARRLLTCKCDVFALGVVLVQCLMGCHPSGCDQGSLVAATRDLSTLLPRVPVDLVALLQRMLNVEAARRPSPEQLIAELSAVLPTLP
jgi:serine/threonine protein kinase